VSVGSGKVEYDEQNKINRPEQLHKVPQLSKGTGKGKKKIKQKRRQKDQQWRLQRLTLISANEAQGRKLITQKKMYAYQ
jgi:hypothetical protein